MPTFDFIPDFGIKKKTKPLVKAIKFGDGYEQRSSFGMNTMPKDWSLKFVNRDNSEADAIEAFLVARGAVESFDWTPPGESAALKFVCREWDKVPEKPGLSTVTADFEQVFEP